MLSFFIGLMLGAVATFLILGTIEISSHKKLLDLIHDNPHWKREVITSGALLVIFLILLFV